jgi:hypothetical protein
MASPSHPSFTLCRTLSISPAYYLTVIGEREDGASWWVALQSDPLQATTWFREDVTVNGQVMVKIYCIAENHRKAYLTEPGSDCGGEATCVGPHCYPALVDCNRHEEALWCLCGHPYNPHTHTMVMKADGLRKNYALSGVCYEDRLLGPGCNITSCWKPVGGDSVVLMLPAANSPPFFNHNQVWSMLSVSRPEPGS